MINKFKERPVSKGIISKRVLLCGVGVNDAKYSVQIYVGGKHVKCPFYCKWSAMVNRCYSNSFHKNQPSYIGCYVCDNWLIFSNFKKWMIKQKWEGNDLDKDILNPGNKIYSPETCVFVSRQLNSLIIGITNIIGEYPKGVRKQIQNGMFEARIRNKGKSIYLGLYKTPKEASKIYIKEKVRIILSEAESQKDNRIKNGLRLHANLLAIDIN